MAVWHCDTLPAPERSQRKTQQQSNSNGELTNSNSSKASSIATPDLTTSINQTVAIMILSSFLAISCLISPVFLDNEMVRKKLVRRRKQGWQSEEMDGYDLSPRHISPVKKVFKRKIINSDGGQKQVVRRKVMPHILPDKHNIDNHFSPPNRILPTTANQSISPSYMNEAVPNKPMDAKRCKYDDTVIDCFIF